MMRYIFGEGIETGTRPQAASYKSQDQGPKT